MSLKVMVKGIFPIEDLVKRFPSVKPLRDISLKRCDDIRWNFDNHDIFDLQVMFIGKTGYGKSSTINFITGKDILKTSDIQVCTKYYILWNTDCLKTMNSFLLMICRE